LVNKNKSEHEEKDWSRVRSRGTEPVQAAVQGERLIDMRVMNREED
jgi:hypothetical protein